MARKGENIYKRKDNRWEARILTGYTEDGQRKYHSVYGKTYKEARQKKQEYLLKNPAKPEKTFENYFLERPFKFYIQQWLEIQKSKVKASTYCTYTRIFQAQILSELGEIPLKQISVDFIEDFLQRKAYCGRCDGKGGLSLKTIADIQCLLNAVFTFIAIQHPYQNPIKNLKNPVSKPVIVEPLTEKEYQLFTRFLLQQDSLEALGILSSLYMGLRLGEVCALRWENIDLDRGIFKIRYTLYRVLGESAIRKTELTISSPKTQSSLRDIPIPAFLLPILKEKYCSSECYFITGTPFYIEPRTYQNHFKKYLKECGIRDIPYHCLRHTFATNCIILDFDIKTLSEILGHANTSITLNRYVHSSLYRKQLQMKKLSDTVSAIY